MLMGRSIILLLGIVAILFSSCMKDGNSSEEMDSPSFGIAGLSIFNAIPGSKGAFLTLNGKRINKTDDVLPFGSHINHQNVYAGEERELMIENLAATGTIERAKLKINLASTAAYSLFLYKDADVHGLLSKDNLLSPRDGYAKLRVVHLVKDASPVEVLNGSTLKQVFANIPFKTVTDFIEIKAGQSLKLKIKPIKGDSELAEISIDEKELMNKAVYTLLIKGLVNTAEESQKVGISLIRFE